MVCHHIFIYLIDWYSFGAFCLMYGNMLDKTTYTLFWYIIGQNKLICVCNVHCVVRVFAWRFTEKHCCWICADLQLVFHCNLHETLWKTFTGLAVLQKTVLCLIMCWTLGQARTRSLKVFLTMSRSLPPDQVIVTTLYTGYVVLYNVGCVLVNRWC